MAKIKVNNLNKTGLDLFDDSESYLNELTESEINLMGGIYWSYYFRKNPPIRNFKIWAQVKITRNLKQPSDIYSEGYFKLFA